MQDGQPGASSGVAPTVRDLQEDARYTLLLTLAHDAVLPFVGEWMRRPLPVIRVYKGLVALLALLSVAITVLNAQRGVPTGSLWLQAGLAIAANVTLLLALHEALHAIAYRALGAPRVTFGMDPARLVFYAVADGHVIGGGRYLVVALAPLVVINLALAALGLLVSRWATFAAISLFLHTLNAVGDVALVAYVLAQGLRRVYTYDDVAAHRTFYYLDRAGQGAP